MSWYNPSTDWESSDRNWKYRRPSAPDRDQGLRCIQRQETNPTCSGFLKDKFATKKVLTPS
jgi:hypothetical protein